MDLVPSVATRSATSWLRRCGQPEGSSPMSRMFPTRHHHLCMAAILLSSMVLLLIAAHKNDHELCVKKHWADPKQVIDFFTRPSEYNDDLAKVFSKVMATALGLLILLVLIRWTAHSGAPVGFQNSLSYYSNAESPEEVQVECKKFFHNLIQKDIENCIIYAILLILFILLSSSNVFNPDILFRSSSPEDIRRHPIVCYRGFGFYGWLKTGVIVLSTGFAAMLVVCIINLHHEYLHLKRNEEMTVGGMGSFKNQNDPILLKVLSLSPVDVEQNEDINPNPTHSVAVEVHQVDKDAEVAEEQTENQT